MIGDELNPREIASELRDKGKPICHEFSEKEFVGIIDEYYPGLEKMFSISPKRLSKLRKSRGKKGAPETLAHSQIATEVHRMLSAAQQCQFYLAGENISERGDFLSHFVLFAVGESYAFICSNRSVSAYTLSLLSDKAEMNKHITSYFDHRLKTLGSPSFSIVLTAEERAHLEETISLGNLNEVEELAANKDADVGDLLYFARHMIDGTIDSSQRQKLALHNAKGRIVMAIALDIDAACSMEVPTRCSPLEYHCSFISSWDHVLSLLEQDSPVESDCEVRVASPGQASPVGARKPKTSTIVFIALSLILVVGMLTAQWIEVPEAYVSNANLRSLSDSGTKVLKDSYALLNESDFIEGIQTLFREDSSYSSQSDKYELLVVVLPWVQGTVVLASIVVLIGVVSIACRKRLGYILCSVGAFVLCAVGFFHTTLVFDLHTDVSGRIMLQAQTERYSIFSFDASPLLHFLIGLALCIALAALWYFVRSVLDEGYEEISPEQEILYSL